MTARTDRAKRLAIWPPRVSPVECKNHSRSKRKHRNFLYPLQPRPCRRFHALGRQGAHLHGERLHWRSGMRRVRQRDSGGLDDSQAESQLSERRVRQLRRAGSRRSCSAALYRRYGAAGPVALAAGADRCVPDFCRHSRKAFSPLTLAALPAPRSRLSRGAFGRIWRGVPQGCISGRSLLQYKSAVINRGG